MHLFFLSMSMFTEEEMRDAGRELSSRSYSITLHSEELVPIIKLPRCSRVTIIERYRHLPLFQWGSSSILSQERSMIFERVVDEWDVGL